eukprot:tig00020614_g12196.t1
MRGAGSALGLLCVATLLSWVAGQVATPSPAGSAPRAPPVPTGLRSLDYSTRYLSVAWDFPIGADASVVFELQASLRTAGANDTQASFVRTQRTTAAVSGLIPGRVYAVRVRTVDPRFNVSSAFSDGLAFLMRSEVPDPPARLRQVSKTGTSVTIAWDRPNDNGESLFGYEVEMDNGPGTELRGVRNTSREGFRVDFLNMGVWYRFRVSASNMLGRGPYSQTLSIRTSAPPEQPEPPTLILSRDFSLVVGYVPPDPNDAAIDLYRIDIDRLEGGGPFNSASTAMFAVAGTTAALEFEARGLVPAHPYALRVAARNANGFGPPSHPAVFSTRPGAPLAPVNLTAWSRTPYSLNLTWGIPWDSGSPVTRVEVWRGPSVELEFSPLGNASVTSYEVRGLRPGTMQAYKVRAVNAYGPSPFSEAVELLTLPTNPEIPVNLRALYVNSSYAIVVWDPGRINGALFIRYEVEVSIPAGPKVDNRAANVTETEYKGANMYPGMTYALRVRTRNAVGPSDFTDFLFFQIDYRVPDAPDAPFPIDHTRDSITVGWLPPAEDGGKPITGYVVYIDDGFSGPFGIYTRCPSDRPDVLQCTISDLKPNQYRVRVAARNAVGLSVPSGILSYATFFEGLDVYDFSVGGGIALAGAAHINTVNGHLSLTDSLPNDALSPEGYAGAAWSMQSVDIEKAFDVRWVFAILRQSATCKAPVNLPRDCVRRGGDGFAFVIWAASNASQFAVGDTAEGLGYAGIPNSVAVEFDTWSNSELGDPYDNHVAVQTRGPLPNSANHTATLAAANAAVPDLNDGAEHRGRVVYTPWFDHALLSGAVAGYQVGAGPPLFPFTDPLSPPGVLAVFVDDRHVLSVPIDLRLALDWTNGTSVLRLGFTAGTGTAYQAHDLVTWLLFSGLEDLST